MIWGNCAILRINCIENIKTMYSIIKQQISVPRVMAYRHWMQPTLTLLKRRITYKAVTENITELEITPKIAIPARTQRDARLLNVALGSRWADSNKGEIDFSSCDYLAIGHDRAINEAHAKYIMSQISDGKAAWAKTGVWPRTRESPLFKFQEKAAEWLKADAVVLTKSGMDANCSLMEILLKYNDNIPVYLDFLVHATFRYGIKAMKGKMIVFKHNDLVDLEAKMTKRGPGFIIVDSIYSSIGTIAPLKGMCDLAEKYGSALIVDESHALGVHGHEGNGIVCQLGLEDRVHFRTSALTKGLACNGGIFTGRREFVGLFRGGTTKFAFSNAVEDHEAVRLINALETVKQANDKRKSLQIKFTYFKQELRNLGYMGYYLDPPTQLFGLVTGDYDNTVRFDRALKAKGIYATTFVYPGAPRDRSLLRFNITDDLTKEQLDYTYSSTAIHRRWYSKAE
ncbi:unnamed protein product [Owenia fusiformis]|uniref:Aminotransferase class I/classII large domain-containing protein n=1 Tax=Owenia fusiformis TaxID=6347 RepID=A0A8J1YB09_OWEFU|nr:unnamed protein product [Owenia fusiformis]